jgi:MHS family proline/betaine transporter-like MFS transporter
VLIAFGLLAASYTGVAPTTLSNMFPARVRVTGVSLAYNVAFTIFGGFAPPAILAATRAGYVLAPAWYVALAAVPALIAALTGNRMQSNSMEPVRDN